MSESKHTPGPWEWSVSGNHLYGGDDEVLAAADDGRPYGMHSALIEHHYDEAVAEANRNLIAAAPDLLECLERYVELEERSAPYSSSPMREKARAAIAKAKGGAA